VSVFNVSPSMFFASTLISAAFEPALTTAQTGTTSPATALAPPS
jgi:hypothetical protein